MKKNYYFILLLLIFTLCLSSCGRKIQSEKSQQMETSTSIDEIDETGDSISSNSVIEHDVENLNNSNNESSDSSYDTSVTFDQATNIQRTTLDSKGYPLSVYFEIPVFDETKDEYKKINEFFQKLSDDFFSKKNESLNSVWETATTVPLENDKFRFENNAIVTEQTEQYVSVSIMYEWWMGGVSDYGSNSYVFRTDTGEQLQLKDFFDCTEDEIKEMILSALEEKDAGEGAIDLENVKKYNLKDFEFQIRDGKVYIIFDKYEAAYGAYGGFEIELPVKPKLMF